jgi:hypothetical protein
MVQSTVITRFIIGIAFGPSMALAVAPSVLPPLTAVQVVEKNVAARGGLAAWEAVQSLSWKGRLGAGASTYTTVSPAGKLQTRSRDEAQLPFTLEFKRPLKARLELEVNSQTAVQVYDGAEGWKLRPFLGRNTWEAYNPQELQQAADEPGIDGLLINYAAKGSRVESDGTDKVENQPAYKLKVILKNGQVRHVWVDGASFLDVKVDGVSRRLDGRQRAVEVFLRDFKAEQGLMIPHRLETVVQGVKTKENIQIEKVVVNPPLSDARFTKS